MLGVWILLAVLAAPYLVVNLRRVRSGKRWAYTFCALGRDWEQRMLAEARAAWSDRHRPASPAQVAVKGHGPGLERGRSWK